MAVTDGEKTVGAISGETKGPMFASKAAIEQQAAQALHVDGPRSETASDEAGVSSTAITAEA